jgi:hypothetical protein
VPSCPCVYTCGDTVCGDESDAATDKFCDLISNDEGAVNEESISSSSLSSCWICNAPVQVAD